jgi:rRNA-processing protein FCF1
VTVVLDTNALMMPVECDLRLFEELERILDGPRCLVPEPVRAELEKLADSSGEEGAAASVGLALAERCQYRETDATYADDAVVELAETEEVEYIVTNDADLRDRLLDANVSVIGLRGKNKLTIIQP